MFFWKQDKEKIETELNFLRMRIGIQADIIENLVTRLDRYERFVRYGIKKDGTPKSKPGRKPKGLL
jgi:hypothetical protein